MRNWTRFSLPVIVLGVALFSAFALDAKNPTSLDNQPRGTMRRQFHLVDNSCGSASVTMTSHGYVVAGDLTECGLQPLSFLWRPSEGSLMVSVNEVRLSLIFVDLKSRKWVEEGSIFPPLTTSRRREIDVIVAALASMPLSPQRVDDWPGEPPPGGGEACTGHYMMSIFRSCPPCAPYTWYYADSRYTVYSSGYRSEGLNDCGCTEEGGCSNNQ